MSPRKMLQGRRVLVALYLILSLGFFATTLGGFFVAQREIRDTVTERELPLAAAGIHAAIQRELAPPLLRVTALAGDPFLRDWLARGERDSDALLRYLGDRAVFLVSDKTANRYAVAEAARRMSVGETRDGWYYRLRDSVAAVRTELVSGTAQGGVPTFAVHHRLNDRDGRFIGAVGVTYSGEAIARLLGELGAGRGVSSYFVDAQGEVLPFGDFARPGAKMSERADMHDLFPRIYREKSGSYAYVRDGATRWLRVEYLPELNWYLFVEKSEDDTLAPLRRTLLITLVACFLITMVVLAVTHLAVDGYQRRIAAMESSDKLTGLFNRQVFATLVGKLVPEVRRDRAPASVVLASVDRFADLNERFGNPVGDRVLVVVAGRLRGRLRESDLAVRWSGDEFLLVLKNCAFDEALRLAETLRQDIATSAFADAGCPYAVTISAGVVPFDPEAPAERSFARAEAALRKAKERGRNRVSGEV